MMKMVNDEYVQWMMSLASTRDGLTNAGHKWFVWYSKISIVQLDNDSDTNFYTDNDEETDIVICKLYWYSDSDTL